jgi:hypothetical protein
MKQTAEIYQLRWYLKGISPLIWRQILLRSDSTLADLHYIIQIAMNWSNLSLHRFTLYGKYFAVRQRGLHKPTTRTTFAWMSWGCG